MKRYATTIALVVLAIVLGVWLWLDRDKVTQGEKKRRENDVFTAWRKDELSRIEIAHEGDTLVLERDAKADSSWRMTSPRKERADQAAVERLTTALELASVVRKVGEATTLGLDPPRASGSITMGSLVFRFALGGESPRPEGTGYFRVDDGAPVVVSKDLVAVLLAPSDTYRDRTVVPYLSLELQRFEVRHAGGGFTLDWTEGRQFKLAELGVAASREALARVWEAMAEARAEVFPKGIDEAKLAAAPRVTIRMKPKDAGKPDGVFLVGDACPDHPDDVLVMRTEPTRVVACAPKSILGALEAKPDTMVDKAPFLLHADEIEELRLERVAGEAKDAIELARKGTGFHLRSPQDRDLTPGEADAVSDLLTRIQHAQADSVTRGDGAPPMSVAYRARAHAGTHEEVLEIGDEAEDGRFPARRARDGARLVLSRATARMLLPRTTTLLPRTLLGDTRKVTRVLVQCGTKQELVDDPSGFKMVEPVGYEADGSILQLVEALTRGNVDAWVADEDDGSFGLAAESCRVVLSFEGGNAPATVKLGPRGEGGVYGVIEGSSEKPGVFVASNGFADLFKRIYVSRASLRVDPTRIDRVRVTTGGREVKGVSAEVQADVIGSLYADKVLSLGAPKLDRTDVEIDVTIADGGPSKRISCGPLQESGLRPCVTPNVRAVFAIMPSKLAKLLGEPASDAGAPHD